MESEGILYIATGDQFVDEAELSAQFVRDAMPNIPIAIATETETEFDFDYKIEISNPKHGFVDQISNLTHSPFDKTLYIDTDIYINSDVTELFDLLNQFDIGVAHNHDREAYDPLGVPDCFPEYNTGVVVYRNDDEFYQFTKTWEEHYSNMYSEENTQNQPSFRKSLFESNLRIATLTPEYNCMVRYPGHVRKKVKIAHSRILDIQSPGADKAVDVIDATTKLNDYDGHRIFLPNNRKGVTIFHAHDLPIHRKALNSIRWRGISQTIQRGVPYVLRRLQKIFK